MNERNAIPPEPAPRTDWVDAAKGIGIILVVLGHVLRGLLKRGETSPIWIFVDDWIYAFHMPLFFFLSGLFLERSCRRGLWNFVDGKLRTILWPYFVWSLIQEIIRRSTAVSKEPISDLWTILYKPVMQFWFLYVLFILLVAYALWRRCGLSQGTFVLAAFSLYLSLGFGVNYGSWGVLYQILHYIPYLALGLLAARWKWMNFLPGSRSHSLTLSASCLYLLLALFVVSPVAGKLPGVLVAAIIGISATLCLSQLLSRSTLSSIVRQFGRLSLDIFVAHSIFTAAFRTLIYRLSPDGLILQIIGGTLVGLGGPLVLHDLCKRFHLLFLFSLPNRNNAHLPQKESL